MSNTRYQLEQKSEHSNENNLLYVSSSQYGADWHSELHTHACTELFYCVCGIGEFRADGVTFPVGSDDLVIINPNVVHTEVSIPSNPLEYIVLGVDGMSFRFGEQHTDAYAILNYREFRDEIIFYLRELLREAQDQPAGWEDVCRNLFAVLLTKIQRHTDYTIDPVTIPRANKDCAIVKRYIDEHFTEPLTLDMLTEYIHVNKYYLAHAFRKTYGISPINYLNEKRIQESIYMLENTDYSLSQIAHLLGFSSPSYFSQRFRRAQGISPAAYRKQINQNQSSENTICN